MVFQVIQALFLFLGLLFSLFLVWRQSRKTKIEENFFFDGALLVILISLFGARLQYILLNWPEFGFSPIKFLYFIKFPGFGPELGLAFGLAALLLYAKKLKLHPWKVLDLSVLGFASGALVVNIGQTLPFNWPAVINSLSLFAIFFLLKLASLESRYQKPGVLAFDFLLLYSSSKFLLDFYSPGSLQFGQFSLDQWFSVFIVFILTMTALFRSLMKIKFPPSILTGIKKFLEDKQKETKNRIHRLKKEDPFSNPDRINDNAAVDTDAAEEVGHERVQALQSEMSKNLVRIRKTLTKIKVGKYGLCEKCGQLIDTDRLAVMPEAEYCIQCQKTAKK